MKATIPMSLALLLFCTLFSIENASGQPSAQDEASIIKASNEDTNSYTSGLAFTVQSTAINTKYSEFSSGTFRNKLILVSSKKIGGLGNGIDKHTNEPYTELFCLDIDGENNVSNPLLFSRILNTKHNEGQVAFSPNERFIYYTRSQRDNSENYQLYKATLQLNSHGNWVNHQQLTFNTNYSVEHPFVSADGKTLYFASNKPGGLGGYDIYAAAIAKNGSIGMPKNLGDAVNTHRDEIYPSSSIDGKQLYFSSNGHDSLGGFDIMVSSHVYGTYIYPINLGETVNSSFDEVAFRFLNTNQGYFSSNRFGGKGSFDLYKFNAEAIAPDLEDSVVNTNTKDKLKFNKEKK